MINVRGYSNLYFVRIFMTKIIFNNIFLKSIGKAVCLASCDVCLASNALRTGFCRFPAGIQKPFHLRVLIDFLTGWFFFITFIRQIENQIRH